MASKLFADMTIDSMYHWMKLWRGNYAHLIPKPGTGLTMKSHCGLVGNWRTAKKSTARCETCEREHARLTHGAPDPAPTGGRQ